MKVGLSESGTKMFTSVNFTVRNNTERYLRAVSPVAHREAVQAARGGYSETVAVSPPELLNIVNTHWVTWCVTSCFMCCHSLHRNSIIVVDKPNEIFTCDCNTPLNFSVYMWMFVIPVVVVCLKSCNYCVTASKNCWFQSCLNSSPEVFQRLRAEERRMDRFFFALWRGTFFSCHGGRVM